jgi:hypothetical protein
VIKGRFTGVPESRNFREGVSSTRGPVFGPHSGVYHG